MRRRLIIACAVAAATGGHAFVVLNSPGPRRAALRQQPPPPLRRRRALVAPRHRGPCAPLQGASPPSLEPPSVAAHDSPPPPPPPHGGGLSEDDGAAVLVAEGGTGAPHYDDGGERGEWPRLEDAHSSSSSSSSSTTTTTTRDSSSTTATPADDAVAGRGKEEDAAVALAYGGVLSFPATLPFAGPIAKKLEDPRFEVVLFAVVLISCLLFALETLPMEREVLDTIDTLQDNVSTLFALEFALKWYAQFGLRFTSLFEPVMLIDAAAGLPALLRLAGVPLEASALSFLRLLRVLQLQRFVRDAASWRRLQSAIGLPAPLDERAVNTQLQIARVVSSVFTLLFVASALIYNAEHVVNPKIPDFLTALYFGLTTLTTVGFGDITPVTFEGRLIVCVSVLAGIAVIPVQLASLAEALFAGSASSGSNGLATPPPLPPSSAAAPAPTAGSAFAAAPSATTTVAAIAAAAIPLPYVRCALNGAPLLALVDTSAPTSLLTRAAAAACGLATCLAGARAAPIVGSARATLALLPPTLAADDDGGGGGGETKAARRADPSSPAAASAPPAPSAAAPPLSSRTVIELTLAVVEQSERAELVLGADVLARHGALIDLDAASPTLSLRRAGMAAPLVLLAPGDASS